RPQPSAPVLFYAKPKNTARAACGWGRPSRAAFDVSTFPPGQLSGNGRRDAFRTTSTMRAAARLVTALGVVDEGRAHGTERVSALVPVPGRGDHDRLGAVLDAQGAGDELGHGVPFPTRSPVAPQIDRKQPDSTGIVSDGPSQGFRL